MIDEMELFVKQHMNQAVKKLSNSHRLIPAYPDRALFEGIIISQRRNPVVCNVLVRCMVMEASGTGFERIVEEYHNASAAHRPYIFVTIHGTSPIRPQTNRAYARLPHLRC